MNGLYAGLILTAVLLDVAMLVGPMARMHSMSSFLAVLGVHVAVSAVVAQGGLQLLPQRFRGQTRWTRFLLFDLAFMAPLIGPLGILLVSRGLTRRKKSKHLTATSQAVNLPEYDIRTQDPQRGNQGTIRSRLAEHVPQSVRMKSLLTLQAVPSRVANPIREALLADQNDDVRLVAFGMLEKEEKKLTVHIHQEQKNLVREQSPGARYSSLRHLAELHWEMVYAGLAQGELRRHVLSEARDYLEQALALQDVPDSGMMLLKGRILLAQGQTDEAEAALRQALILGHSEVAVLPYLAEQAYLRGNYAQVRSIMLHLQEHHVAASDLPMVKLWVGNEDVQRVSNRHVVQHL